MEPETSLSSRPGQHAHEHPPLAAMGAASSRHGTGLWLADARALSVQSCAVAARPSSSARADLLLSISPADGSHELAVHSDGELVRWQADPTVPAATRSTALLAIPRRAGLLTELRVALTSTDTGDIYLAYAFSTSRLDELAGDARQLATCSTAVLATLGGSGALECTMALPTDAMAGKLAFAVISSSRGVMATFALWLEAAAAYGSPAPAHHFLPPVRDHSLPPTPSDSHVSSFTPAPARPNGVVRANTSPNLASPPLPDVPRFPPPLPPRLDLPDLSLDAEDGPLFRATLAELEKRAASLRKSAKTLSKAADTSLLAFTAFHEAENRLDEALAEIAESNPAAVTPLADAYLRDARFRARTSRRDALTAFEEGVCAPLRRLLNVLKAGETKRKTFESESKAYYDGLAKYLGKPEKDDEGNTKRSDDKQHWKRQRFDIARFEWHACLLDLALFREAELLTLLAHYARVRHTIDAHQTAELASLAPSLDRFTETYAEDLAKSVEARCTAIELRRRELEARCAASAIEAGEAPPAERSMESVEPLDRLGKIRAAAKHRSLQLSGAMSPSISAPVLSGPAKVNGSRSPYRGYRDLEPVETECSTERKREGFLWATTRPNMPQTSEVSRASWHKFWVVLSGGQLIEYSGWRDGLAVHGTPTNLRFATVREARLQDRRFTFEVITTQTRRVYQATSEAEAKQWQRAIANCIESLLNGTSSVRGFDASHLQEGQQPGEMGAAGLVKSPSAMMPISPTLAGPSAALDRLTGWASKPLARRSSAGGEATRHRKRDSASAKLQAGLQSMGIVPRDRQTSASSTGISNRASLAALSEASKSTSALYYDQPTLGLGLGFAPGWERARTKSTGSSAPSSSGDDFDRRIAETVESMSLGREADAEKAKCQVELEALLARPENRICADCGRADPKWASWSLGTFICLQCSGVHRSLGTHISKVRSVDLDQWSAEQLAPLREIGNARARDLYGPPATPNADVASFIKERYTPATAALAVQARAPTFGIAL